MNAARTLTRVGDQEVAMKPIQAAGALMIALALIATSPPIAGGANGRTAHSSRRERFTHSGAVDGEDSPALDAGRDRTGAQRTVSEALTGFDNRTNGFTPQGPPYDSLDEESIEPLRSFNDNRFISRKWKWWRTAWVRCSMRRAAASAIRTS
jgi:hypothetical protein